MSTKQPVSSARTHPVQRTHAGNNHTWWIIPKPFDLVSTILYLGIVAELFYNMTSSNPYRSMGQYISWQNVVLISVCIVILLDIDRIEYWYYGEETPAAMAMGLLIVRICLIETINRRDPLDISSFLELL